MGDATDAWGYMRGPRDRPPQVRCALCSTPVQRITQTYCAITKDDVFIVECHGEKETMRISMLDISEGMKIVGGGLAFQKNLLTDGEDRDV